MIMISGGRLLYLLLDPLLHLCYVTNIMTFAIIKTGGKQYLVRPGDKIKVEKLDVPEGKGVVFDSVLLVGDGDNTLIGTPRVKEYQVKGEVLRQGKGKKIIVFKYKPKKRYHKKQGHRQLFSEVKILEITGSRDTKPRTIRKKGGASEKRD